MIRKVRVTKWAQKNLESCPRHIQSKFKWWLELVERIGIEAARLIPGLHDEPLKGNRTGQRSIRLNRSWRAIYVLREDGCAQGCPKRYIEFIEVQEIHKHDY